MGGVPPSRWNFITPSTWNQQSTELLINGTVTEKTNKQVMGNNASGTSYDDTASEASPKIKESFDYCIKLLIIGDGSVGKVSTLQL